MSENLHYSGENLAEFYLSHRREWASLYPSEQRMFELLFEREGKMGSVLDVGCAVGGLGEALHERFGIESYTGVDVNAPSIEAARTISHNFPSEFHCEDIVEMEGLPAHDVVASLGCADFNCSTVGIVEACWNAVRPGGSFVVSLRLTDGETVNDMEVSSQKITFGKPEGDGPVEVAPYVVMNWREALGLIGRFQPARISSFGIWGTPSETASTPFERVVFSVWVVTRRTEEDAEATTDTQCDLDWPLELFGDAAAS